MSIAKLVRVGIVGSSARRAEALASLQALGLVHLDGLPEAMRDARRARESAGERARQALRYVTGAPRIRAQVRDDPHFDVAAFVDQALDNQEARRVTQDARDAVARRIAIVAPWGEFTLPPSPEAIGGRLWFYAGPAREAHRFERLGLPWTIVRREAGKAYVVVITPQEPIAAPFPRSHVGGHGLSELTTLRDTLDLRLDELEFAREAMTRRVGLLARDLAIAEDQGVLQAALELSASGEEVFVLSGWAPVSERAALFAWAADAGVAVLIGDPGPDEAPPTLLRPHEAVAAGADLTRLYQLPAARAWDPSGVVFFSFATFFALIVSDAGYGLVLLGLALLFWRALSRAPAARRLRGLWLTAAGLTIAWGCLVGSYFGAGAPHPALARLQVFSMADYDTMMALSVGLGAAHVALANLAAAWANRLSRAGATPLGWAVLIGAGVLAWTGGDAIRPYAYGLGAGGLLLVAIGAGGPLSALATLTKATSLFADILSYLRLFALGLAGASLAIAFNNLAADAAAGAGALGPLAGGAILLVGHSLNFALAVMGGVVHGLRLNMIEFFNWGLGAEGRPFEPFARSGGVHG
jgi:V/A-type H+-transporting ATPase subunit I